MCEREQLLGHPLVISLLKHKWDSYGRHVYYSFLILYIIYLTLLTGYIVFTDPPYQLEQNSSADLSFDKLCALNRSEFKQKKYAFFAKFMLLMLTVFHIFKEMFQFVTRKYNYFTWENFIEWIVYISVVLLVMDFSECSNKTGIRYPWQWQIGAVGVFLAWMNLVLFIRKFPRFGIYVVMFTDILRTFSYFFVVFFLFLIAFAMAFYTLFQNQYPFRDLRHTIIKTAVMMIGEFDFNDIFNDPQNDKHDHKVYHSLLSGILFSAFIATMTLLIMNLLIGLAVDDIKGVQEKAVLKRLAMQVELVLHVEKMMPEWLKRRWIVGRKKIYPNQGEKVQNLIRLLFGAPTQLSMATIAEQINREQDEITKIKLCQEKMSEKVQEMRKRIEDMKNQQERLQSMMKAVVEHFQITWEDEDEFSNIR